MLVVEVAPSSPTVSSQSRKTPRPDVPTTLQTLMGRLDDWLRMHPNRPTVTNPKLPSEDFSPLFGTDDQYSNFRTVIARYRKWIDEAHATEGRQESIAAWQKVFGDEFGKASIIKVAADAAADGFARVHGLLSSTAAHLNELVDEVKKYGISACRSTSPARPTSDRRHGDRRRFSRRSVAGHRIDASAVESFVQDAVIVIAHNRPEIRRTVLVRVRAQGMGCSTTEVEWRRHGFAGAQLGYLLNGAGFFQHAHRAGDDCHASSRSFPSNWRPRARRRLRSCWSRPEKGPSGSGPNSRPSN
ncbi:hypothetical protein [Bradyrhizobium sp. HKCCYLS20291]|uniref:hypothetical protein n=1 Tax=Bradyrhizobium sp. HKCCYLS20291 TaxID=3420766 RepID=UPI003EB788DD